MKIEYNTRNVLSAFYGRYGKMTVRNSMQGVLIQHEEDFYDHQKLDLSKKVVADICNQYRSEYEPSLRSYYSDDDKRIFTQLLDSKIEDAEKLLNDLKFAKNILSRNKAIFEKVNKETP